ncbi:MAG: hypothetical protein A2148_06110 [Chloroflexi bacterium RBG_16_68_14]|nr:MAG: hypothetical protein A2148_06110 [Chloroflexi bacterium RBG_16_68_14]
MVRGEEFAGGVGWWRAADSPPEWLPPKRAVPGSGTAEGPPRSPQARARVLSELGAIVERLERAVVPSAPVASPFTPEPERQAVAQPAAEVQLALREFSQRQEDALSRLDQVAERLLAAVDRLEQRLSELPSPLEWEYSLREQEIAAEGEAGVAEERRFQPGRQAVTIILAPVLDFQGLMEMHRALSRLPAAEGASVLRFRNGEASFALLLRAGMSASQIVETLRTSTGQRLLIEESKPDAQRLRLRLAAEGRRDFRL